MRISVATDISFTMESQCDFDDKFLPTLDMSLQLSMKGTPRMRYKFYKKPMASKLGILQTSALSEQVKSNTITQEVIRRLSHTSRVETLETRISILDDYTNDMIASGYCMDELKNFITPGIVGFERRVSRELQGGAPLHRLGKDIKRSIFRKN